MCPCIKVYGCICSLLCTPGPGSRYLKQMGLSVSASITLPLTLEGGSIMARNKHPVFFFFFPFFLSLASAVGNGLLLLGSSPYRSRRGGQQKSKREMPNLMSGFFVWMQWLKRKPRERERSRSTILIFFLPLHMCVHIWHPNTTLRQSETSTLASSTLNDTLHQMEEHKQSMSTEDVCACVCIPRW